ncbi:YfgM family protein [Amphibiibacter pelophylacis]|uniref:Tetratricopeptide repeat protein n=1 Tax=Amphibiibacter pelophylacis TaxID=1799477 RepID=A0ACC6NZ16_9BURK
MAKALDLDEQEQLESLKSFWNTYGNFITTALLVAALVMAGYSGWRWYQSRQGAQAQGVYGEMESALQRKDVAAAQRLFQKMGSDYAGQTWTAQAGLLLAQSAADAGQTAPAKDALQWVSDKGPEGAYRAVARLRLSALLAGDKQYDAALKLLEGWQDAGLKGLALDQRGDILALQGKKSDAAAAWKEAWQALPATGTYRNIVAAKLASVGENTPADASAAAAGSAS